MNSIEGITETDIKFKGFAAYEPGIVVKPFDYYPRLLGNLDVEIHIKASGVCYSDIHTMREDWEGTEYPVITGHEIAGLVTKVGRNVTKHKVGDRVGVGPQVLSCDDCKLCKGNEDQYCSDRIFTFNDKYEDKQTTYGGYAKHIRVHEKHVIPIPPKLEFKHAAPLLCAGVTLYSPLKYYGYREYMKVAIIGIGGLGHLGIQYAAAKGCRVTAISHRSDKRELSLELGATDFIVSTNEELKKHENEFDMILSTTYHKDMDMEIYCSLLKPSGKFIILGLQTDNMSLPLKPFVTRRIQLCGSVIGSAKDTEESLLVAAKYGIKPMIETYQMNAHNINTALQRVVDGDINFRAVLINDDYFSELME